MYLLYITEACLFGDQLGVITNGMDCSGLVAADPSNCYRTIFRSPCCASCARAYTNISGKYINLLMDLIVNVPVNNISVTLGWVFLG